MSKHRPSELHFDVSSGLKSVLGSELITDDEVAIFELVKNSFDADASQVDLYFGDNTIVVADNGKGMTYDDIRNKWLFVAYSSKRIQRNDFRDDIAERKQYAGSKGIGRFSSDRLGRVVTLQTRSEQELSEDIHSVVINWDLFDVNHQDRFGQIAVRYESKSKDFLLPAEIEKRTVGTVITITETRRPWDRDNIKKLKSALAKLINPFGAAVDGFKIFVHAPSELEKDKVVALINSDKVDDGLDDVINGPVGNFIFSTLQDKTTFIEIRIDPEKNTVESSLTDRGELIYKIREPNKYSQLRFSGFQCQLFFLNQSAKMTFARRMGIPSVQFGSVFLFRNNFRVYPIGDDGDDWFGMDRRKQQGYSRFLGTRDVIGRVDVAGNDNDFKEASSRNAGLIATRAVTELKDFFLDYCLKRLERYVVPVTYVDKEDKLTSDVSRLLTDPGKARVAAAVAKLVDNDSVELIQYSSRLIGILNERSAQFEESLISLRAIAEKTKDATLFGKIEEAEQKFGELKRSEEDARRQADEERAAKEEARRQAEAERTARQAAQARAQNAEQHAHKVSVQLEEEKKRSLFLSSISSLDTDTILNLHHQVTIYAVDIQHKIDNFILRISGKKSVNPVEIIDALEGISLLNKKVLGVTKFATKANFRLQSEKIEANLADYIEQYIEDIAKKFMMGPLTINFEQDNKGFVQEFKPIDVAVVIDNLISNARKSLIRATKISFKITHPNKNSVHIEVDDNGRGFDKRIDDLDRVFEKGFTMTDGSGLGLYHVRHVLGEMNGTIKAVKKEEGQGGMFLIRIAK